MAICSADNDRLRGNVRRRERVSVGRRNGCLCPRERFFVGKELRQSEMPQSEGREGNDNGARGDRGRGEERRRGRSRGKE